MRPVRRLFEGLWTIYRRELRAALREKGIVVNSIVIPLVLYPFLLWAVSTGIAFVMGQTEGFTSRVAVIGAGPLHRPFLRMLETNHKVEVREHLPLATALAALRAGELDAVVEILPAAEGGVVPGEFALRVTVDEAKERSRTARERLDRASERYRSEWLAREARARGVTAADWQGFSIRSRNVSSAREMGQFLLGLLLPMLFVIMVAVGCFYPAVDATAGERERNTWETTMTLAVPRFAVVAAKYLSVATFGGVAGILNVAAMTASMGMIFAPLFAEGGEEVQFRIPLAAVPVLLLGALLLALFVAAGMMIFASFARTFKEGQSMVTPFYLLILLPVMFLQVPGLEFSLALSFVPVVNVTMMVREALSGSFHWPQIGVTVGVSAALVLACLGLAARILAFEDVVMGSFGGSLGMFVKTRLLARRGRGAAGEGAR